MCNNDCSQGRECDCGQPIETSGTTADYIIYILLIVTAIVAVGAALWPFK